MNDYKELIEKLEHYLHLGDAPIGRGWGALIDKQTLKDAINAIEQLVKERDVAVKDLFEEADSRFNTCLYCKKDADCVLDCDNALWEWRGVQE